jgi:hypothetical protein
VSAKNRAYAQQDLENCLRARAYELKPGGYFITTSISEPLIEYSDFFMTAFNSMIGEGLITPQEFLRMNFAGFSRKLADFESALSRNPGLFEISEYLEFSLPQSKISGIKIEISIFRAVSESKILEAIKHSRPSEEAQAVVEAIYARLGQLDFESKPLQYSNHYCVLKRK